MMRSIMVLAALAMGAASAYGQEAPQAPATATGGDIIATIAAVIAAEEPCGLKYDQGAITAYIDAAVPANSTLFPSRFNQQVQMQRSLMTDMTASQKTAFCGQIDRTAKLLQFTK